MLESIIKGSVVTFEVLVYNDDMSLYYRNCSNAMSYLNRFLIDEETENECIGIYESNKLVRPPKVFLTDDESDSSFVHLIAAHNEKATSSMEYTRYMKSIVDHIMNPTWVTSTDTNEKIIITNLCSVRTECVQSEKYKKICKEGGNVRVDSYRTVKVERSVGDDIEDFVEQMELEKRRIGDRKKELNENVITFHLSLLSDKEEKNILAPRKEAIKEEIWRLRKKSANIMRNPMVKEILTWNYKNFKYATRLSENEHNYALSVCYRTSFSVKKFNC